MIRIVGVLRRTFGLVREHVGTDHLGNKYYLIPEQKTWTGKSYSSNISLSEAADSLETGRSRSIRNVSQSSD